MQQQITKTTERIAELEAKIERQQSKIFDCGLTPRSLRRLNRLEQKLEAQQNKLDTLTGLQTKDDEFEQNGLLPDSFTFSARPLADVLTQVDIEIYDSPFDSTFVGGMPLKMQTIASGKYTGHGFATTSQSFVLASGDYWEGSDTQTLTVGDSTWNNWAEYPELVINIFNAGNELIATQSLDPATIFA